jgi:citronellol/citronellal dehydrogenase
MTETLAGKTLFITGGSRGIGLAIALRAAKDGANIVIAAKTAEPHKSLPGTIFSAAAEIEAAGGKALPLQLDIRDDEAVEAAVAQAAGHFGGIDIVINNASAISLTSTKETTPKRLDLMLGVNLRGTFIVTRAAYPFLKQAANPHVLTLSPPLSLKPRWFKHHVAYTIAKYGMSLSVLGHAAEFERDGIAVNALWPRTTIATAALRMIPGIDPRNSRTPQIMADAAWHILTRLSRSLTGQFLIDDEVLAEAGITDLSGYAVEAGAELTPDLFVD